MSGSFVFRTMPTIRVTRELIRAGQLLNIELLDHLIIGEKTISLRELGFFA